MEIENRKKKIIVKSRAILQILKYKQTLRVDENIQTKIMLKKKMKQKGYSPYI